jgi:ABC-type sugar transport system ATPase subunit
MNTSETTSREPATSTGTVALRADGLARSFGETRALRSCTIELRAGEVHAVVGENGSGKSTLVKILAGVLSPDQGTLTVDGRQLARISSPARARAIGIASVFQEILVVEPQSVLDNVWLGADGVFKYRVPEDVKRERATRVLTALLGHPLDLDRTVEELELSERQVVVISRALVQDPRVLILDESTSALDVSTRDRLFAEVRRRCADGTAVVFISHRMDELQEIADRSTVLRNGEVVATLERAQATPARLLQLMSERSEIEARERRVRRTTDRVVLRLDGVVLRGASEPLAIDVHAGEIVGVAGLEGHGQERFVRTLAGLDQPESGRVLRVLDGRDVAIGSQAEAARQRVAYVPRDRKTEGIFEPLSILDNFSLPTIDRDATAGVVSERRRRGRFRTYVDQLKIRYGSPTNRITTLSGGNQQKIVIARWLATEPEIVILNDPTRGVDAGTKGDIYALLDGLTSSGVAVVMLSTEVEEHVTLMDRVLVFHEGRVFAELEGERLTRERLVAGFFGQVGSDDA